MSAPPPIPGSWHPDPSGRHHYRWWDGTRWTTHVATNGVTGTDGQPPAPPASIVPIPTPPVQPQVAMAPALPGWPQAYPPQAYPPTMPGRLTLQDAVRRVLLERYADFSGRASLAEYWWFTLAMLLFYFVAFSAVGFALAIAPPLAGFLGFVLLVGIFALLFPSVAVMVRRLHDTGRSGAWWLIGFIPFGGFVLLVFTLLRGDPWPNQYGPPPPD
jgi:uncharacterized membrane protein YhaH (DUF805 family)